LGYWNKIGTPFEFFVQYAFTKGLYLWPETASTHSRSTRPVYCLTIRHTAATYSQLQLKIFSGWAELSVLHTRVGE
jgi:hypothetical protein